MKDELRWLRNQAVDGDLDQKQTWEVAYEFSFSSVEWTTKSHSRAVMFIDN